MDPPLIRCDDCGKEGFSTTQALAGHKQKHELERLRASGAQPPAEEPTSGAARDPPGPAVNEGLAETVTAPNEGAEGLAPRFDSFEDAGAIILATPRSIAEIEELHEEVEAAHLRKERSGRELSNLRAKVAFYARREADRRERKRRRSELREKAPRRTCFYGCINDACRQLYSKEFLEGQPEFDDPTRYGWKCECDSGIAWIALAEDFPDAEALTNEVRERIAEFENGDYAHRFDQMEGLRANGEIDEPGFRTVSGILESAAQAYEGGSECRSDALDRRVRRELFRSLLRTAPTNP